MQNRGMSTILIPNHSDDARAPRVEPLAPPYEPDDHALLARMVPPGVEPIALFRTFARNRGATAAMQGWGSYVLSRASTLAMRDRELVIDRVCARCGCEYEWGVHVAFFGERVGLTAEQVASLVTGGPDDACWTDPRERSLLRMVDELHDAADVSDATWDELRAGYDDAQLVDLLLLAGWYHAIAYVARAARVALEPWAPRVTDAAGGSALTALAGR